MTMVVKNEWYRNCNDVGSLRVEWIRSGRGGWVSYPYATLEKFLTPGGALIIPSLLQAVNLACKGRAGEEPLFCCCWRCCDAKNENKKKEEGEETFKVFGNKLLFI